MTAKVINSVSILLYIYLLSKQSTFRNVWDKPIGDMLTGIRCGTADVTPSYIISVSFKRVEINDPTYDLALRGCTGRDSYIMLSIVPSIHLGTLAELSN